MLCTNIVVNVKTKKNNFCTQHVLSLYFLGDSINNLLSYCGLTESKMRASDIDLPVLPTPLFVSNSLVNLREICFSFALTNEGGGPHKGFKITMNKDVGDCLMQCLVF